MSAGKTLKTHARKRILSALLGTLNWEWHELFSFWCFLKENKKDFFLWIISWARLIESPCYFDSSRSFRFEKALVIIRYENSFVIFDIYTPFLKSIFFSFGLWKRKKIMLEKKIGPCSKAKTTNCLWFFKRCLPLKLSYVYACQIIFNGFVICNM